MKNLFNRLNNRQKKSAKIIAAMLIVAVVLFAVLNVLPKPKTNNSAKHETSTETDKDDKKDKKDNKQSDKKDDKKKDDTGKKEDKKEDTSTTSETPVTPTTGTTSTEVQNNNNSSSVTNTPSTNTTSAPQPIYQTIHHEEVGHWETQVIAEAWDVPVYERKVIGNQSGHIYESAIDFGENADLYGDGSYHVGDVQVGTTHHDAITQQVWVVDQAAKDETVIVGYR